MRPYDFRSGWNTLLAAKARARFLDSGRRFSLAPQFAGDERPLPTAFSLSGWLSTPFDQGPVGSCFANMGAHVLQIMGAVVAANNPGGPPQPAAFIPSRRLVWYQCRKLDGSLGSRQDGGSIVHTFTALADPPAGIGDCPESEWPYQPDHDYLEQTPPSEVIADAGSRRVTHIAEQRETPDGEVWKRSIFNGRPIGIGIWWPYGWDNQVDEYGRTLGIGRGEYGHAVAVIGWHDDWDGCRWWEILNSHGAIYGTPPPAVASRIAGYRPTSGAKSFSFWARNDLLLRVMSGDWTEAYNAAGVEGFAPMPVNVPDWLDAFPV